VVYRVGKKPPYGFLAHTDRRTRRPYHRLCAAALGDRLRPWARNLLGSLGTEVGNLLGRVGAHLLGAYLVTDNPLVRPANPAMGFGAASPTSTAYLHTALGDSASIAGSVLG
jgi:hypothetical protein